MSEPAAGILPAGLAGGPVGADSAATVPLPRAGVWRVLGPFVVVIVVLVGLCIGGYRVLSAVRAYVGGESLWSKGHSVAVAQLRLYAATGAPQAYHRFLAALEVPLGDRAARVALDAPQPDMAQARAGFLRGGNHPDDIDGMLWLYRGFSDTVLMRDAVAAWREGDGLIAELLDTGRELQRRLTLAEHLSAQEQAALQLRLDALDARLIALEKHFSASLGIASRDTWRLLEWAVVALAAVMGLAVVAYAGRALRRHESGRLQLAEAHQRWSLAAAAAGIGVFEWRADDDRYHFDARASTLLGIVAGPDGGYIERRQWRDRLHADDLPAVRDAVAQAQARGDGAVFRVRCRVRRADSDVRHIEAVGRVRQRASGQREGVLGVLRDVSEETERTRLSIDKAAAEQVARARMEFLSRLSHELRTPLNAVLGFSQLMLTDAAEPLPSAAATRLGHINAAGTHLLRLVDDVLDVTRIDSGQMAVHSAPLLLGPVLQSALAQVESQRQARGIAVETVALPEHLSVRADPVRLEQVFVNLLTNGCKYNRPGGQLRISHRRDGGQVWIDFQDQGEGLTAAEIEALFQPFKRLARHWQVEGTGLGLVIVKLMLAQMGGEIAVASTPGEGSTFSVCLACCDDEH